MNNPKEDSVIDGLLQELRRGTLVLSVLSQLNEPKYGYSLVVVLEQAGITIEAGTLYPLLRRLEKQNILLSTWDTNTAKPRKYYELTDYGRIVYQILRDTWRDTVSTMQKFMESEE